VAAFAGALILVSALVPATQTWSAVFALAATFAPHALALWLFAMLAAVFAARRKAKLLALVMAFGLVCNVLAIAPYTSALFRTATPWPGTALKVMTLNLRFGYADPDAVSALVSAEGAQALVLTEVSEPLAARLAEKLAQTLPYQAGQPSRGNTAEGTMVFARHPLSVVDAAETTYHSVAVEVADPAGRYVVVGVHPISPLHATASWMSDGAAIAALATRQMSSPLIIAGDFNATLEHLPLRRIMATGLADAVRQSESGWVPTYPSDVAFLPPLIGIDHILANRSFHANNAHSVPISGSDHLGLVAELVRK
jgi:endonuclease/exonuclease/phosphatase (EEP) superfamily protein YafD